MTLSPSGRRALAQMLVNHERGIRTHRTAVHQSARLALEARGLIEVDGPNLTLTPHGIEVARQIGEPS